MLFLLGFFHRFYTHCFLATLQIVVSDSFGLAEYGGCGYFKNDFFNFIFTTYVFSTTQE